jgi:hypothetical protein
MRRVGQRNKRGENVCNGKRREAVRSMKNTLPLAERIMGCYRRFGLDKPQKLREGRGYKTIDSLVRKSGLKRIKLAYAPFSSGGYLPIQTLIPESRSKKGQVLIAPEAILTADALLGVFPELVKTGAMSVMMRERERCRGSAMELYRKVEQMVVEKKGGGQMDGFCGPHLDVEIMANVQRLVAHYKRHRGPWRRKLVKELAYDLLFTTCLYGEMGWITGGFNFSERVMMSSVYPRRYSFLKVDVIKAGIERAEEARKELEERVGRCHPDKLKKFSTADWIRREIRVLVGD